MSEQKITSKKSHQQIPKGRARHAEIGHSHNPLSAFSYHPDKIRFVGADSEEVVVLLLRQHPIVNVKWLVTAVFMVLAPFIVSYFESPGFMPFQYQLIALLGWYLVTMAYIIENFLSWFFNVYIITDERVFDVDFHNLVYREITDANIDQIQDVTVSIGSVIRTTFNYGDIFIQTASEVPQIEFSAVPKPDNVALILRELRVEEEQEKIEGRVR